MIEVPGSVANDPDRARANDRSPDSEGDVDGASAVVVSAGGRDRLTASLMALRAQRVAPERFEIVVVLNGPDDGSQALVEQLRDEPGHTIRVIRSERRGVGWARNLGVAAARHAHVLFVDDDDTVGEDHVATLLSLVGPDIIPVAPLVDVAATASGSLERRSSPLVEQIARHAGKDVDPARVPGVLACNAGKLVPRSRAAAHPFPTDTASGEDVAFWFALLAASPFRFRFAPASEAAEYRRLLRPDSLSRRLDADHEFSVAERLAVIAHLDATARRSPAVGALADVLIGGQVDAMNRYLRRHPDAHAAVVDQIERARFTRFPYRRLNAGLATELVVSYCFPPTLDTSGIVAAKRVHERARCVDVISNNMAAVRDTDAAVMRIVDPWIERHALLKVPTNFNLWADVRQFTESGLRELATMTADRAPYVTLYSRAMWPASHVLAAMYKIEHPDVVWRAEFSDPLSHDIHGVRREHPLEEDHIVERIRQAAAERGRPIPDDLPMFSFVEAIPMALADEIIYTNDQQLEVMVRYAETPALAARARELATVSPHPTLAPLFYDIDRGPDGLDQTLTHIAYFGTFYATRGLDDVLRGIALLPDDAREQLRLHVFTARPRDFARRAVELGVDDVVVAREYVPFLRFLHLCTRFDALVLSDTQTSASHDVSPYLPSKWSDYRGSGTPVWAVIEPGSPLDREQMAYRSLLGDADGARRVLEQIVDTARARLDTAPAADRPVAVPSDG